MRKIKISSIFALALLMFSFSANAQWNIPAADADKMAPFEMLLFDQDWHLTSCSCL